MKKLLLASMILAAAPSAFALNTTSTPNTIHFAGNVVEKTCNISIFDPATGSNTTVSLGNVSTSTKGNEIPFSMKIVSDDDTTQPCPAIKNNIRVKFIGDFNDAGLENTRGSAIDTTILLKQDDEIMTKNSSVTETFDKDEAMDIEFTAQLDASKTTKAGTVDSIVSYVIEYM